jgi:hypothetical protein
MSNPQQQHQQQQSGSYNGQGSIQTMTELYEVGEVIGTGTFGIIRKVRLLLARLHFQHPSF